MSRVDELTPGDLVINAAMSATFVARADHPLYPDLQLVVWKMSDGGWIHDALSARQDVGSIFGSTPAERVQRLRAALLGGGR